MTYLEKLDYLAVAFGHSTITLFNFIKKTPNSPLYKAGELNVEATAVCHSVAFIQEKQFSAPTDEAVIDMAWNHFFGDTELDEIELPTDFLDAP